MTDQKVEVEVTVDGEKKSKLKKKLEALKNWAIDLGGIYLILIFIFLILLGWLFWPSGESSETAEGGLFGGEGLETVSTESTSTKNQPNTSDEPSFWSRLNPFGADQSDEADSDIVVPESIALGNLSYPIPYGYVPKKDDSASVAPDTTGERYDRPPARASLALSYFAKNRWFTDEKPYFIMVSLGAVADTVQIRSLFKATENSSQVVLTHYDTIPTVEGSYIRLPHIVEPTTQQLRPLKVLAGNFDDLPNLGMAEQCFVNLKTDQVRTRFPGAQIFLTPDVQSFDFSDRRFSDEVLKGMIRVGENRELFIRFTKNCQIENLQLYGVDYYELGASNQATRRLSAADIQFFESLFKTGIQAPPN